MFVSWIYGLQSKLASNQFINMMGCQQRYTASAVEAKLYVVIECTKENLKNCLKNNIVCMHVNHRIPEIGNICTNM